MANRDYEGPRLAGFETLSLHAGQQPDPATGARATPIYQSAAFAFPDSDFAAGLFNMERMGHVYSRLSNPTNAVLEERIAALEGGVGAIATASGQAAIHLAIVTLCSAGDHIVASRSLYGGTHNLLEFTLPRFGIETTFVNPRDPTAFERAIQKNTRLIFGETLGNPGLEVLNIPAIAEISKSKHIPFLKPLDHGADIIVHSATKFLSGHGIVIGGLLVDGGTFEWNDKASKNQSPTLTQPYSGFHDLVFADEFGTQAFITRARKEGIRDFGACMSPTTAFYVLQGLETLPLRMQKHVDNTRRVVQFLSEQNGIDEVVYPELETHPDNAMARALMPDGVGAVLSFNIVGGRESGRKFIESLELFSHLANVGDAKSLVIHPASTTHHRMSRDDLQIAGIEEGTIRLSVGLEDPLDLIEDLRQALKRSQR